MAFVKVTDEREDGEYAGMYNITDRIYSFEEAAGIIGREELAENHKETDLFLLFGGSAYLGFEGEEVDFRPNCYLTLNTKDGNATINMYRDFETDNHFVGRKNNEDNGAPFAKYEKIVEYSLSGDQPAIPGFYEPELEELREQLKNQK